APRPLPRLLRDRDERETRWAHERLLRSRDDDVDAPRIGLERNSAEARHGVDDDDRARVAGNPCERLDVRHDTGRGLGVHDDDDFRPRLAETRAQIFRSRSLSPPVAALA